MGYICSMKFLAEIEILPKKGLLDPQGKAVLHGMSQIGLPQVSDVRVGKFITLELEAASEAEATKAAETASKKLLANLIMESYTVRVKAL